MNLVSYHLLDTISEGGPLADWFRQASVEVRSAIEKALAASDAGAFVATVSQTAQEHLVRGVEESPLTVLRQCGAGCNACCHTVAADITPLEAIVAAQHLLARASSETVTKVCQRLAENAARRAAMSAEERARIRLRCGLLGDNGLCQVYEARPLVCAGVFSLSRSACELAATHSDPASQRVPLDRPAKAWTMGVSGGLQRVLVEAGLDGNLYELNSIVLRALQTADVSARWLAKEDVFAGCLCTDAHSPPRRTEAQYRVDGPHAGPKPAANGRAPGKVQTLRRLS
jgi:Fe-S-cluster containining protein